MSWRRGGPGVRRWRGGGGRVGDWPRGAGGWLVGGQRGEGENAGKVG